MTAATTLARARAGSEAAFGELTEPHRRALLLHCYRMLGSLQDAEDAVQETFVSAWRGLEGFEERASLRAWLYRIATNRCLNMRRDASRRPAAARLPFTPPKPTRLGEVPWLEPYPDALLEGLPDAAPGPDARYELREAVGLAFVTALQRLPARQRAALVLRDVLGYRAAEAAALLGATEATVTSALQRARAALEERLPPRERAPAPGSAAERAAAERFADAFASGDVDRIVALLTRDAWVTMPPEPFEYQGRPTIAAFLRHVRADARARGGRRGPPPPHAREWAARVRPLPAGGGRGRGARVGPARDRARRRRGRRADHALRRPRAARPLRPPGRPALVTLTRERSRPRAPRRTAPGRR